MKHTLLLGLALVLLAPLYGQDNEIRKTGLSFGPLPVVAFDQDKGFQYGALLQITDFGNGELYPNYRNKWYFEVSAYTKGTQQYIVEYDSRTLIKGVRTSITARYLNEKAYDFYGWNGYQSYFDSDVLSPYYRYRNRVFRGKIDLQGNITDHLKWEAGYHASYFNISPVDLDNLNKGKSESERFEGETLYEQYVKWGLIASDQADGGLSSALRAGLVYDTRDVELSPSRGIWADAHLIMAPSMFGTTHPYYRYSVTWRNYLPLSTDRLVFAYRLIYQGTIGSDAPFYVLPLLTNMGTSSDYDCVGGFRSVRGLLRNRVQGLDVAFGNVELRWQFARFQLWNQNIALGLNAFVDCATVTRSYPTAFKGKEEYRAEYDRYFADAASNDSLHTGYGGGLRFIMNRNFIVACEYALPANKQDADGGSLYINIGYLF